MWRVEDGSCVSPPRMVRPRACDTAEVQDSLGHGLTSRGAGRVGAGQHLYGQHREVVTPQLQRLYNI